MTVRRIVLDYRAAGAAEILSVALPRSNEPRELAS
jgi:hypothetical protein